VAAHPTQCPHRRVSAPCACPVALVVQVQHLYIGMRWGSAPDGVKSHDFQYWWPLSVADGGGGDGGPALVPMQWVDKFTLTLA
jgi:hypothetical protein